jgi:hypothetical protein
MRYKSGCKILGLPLIHIATTEAVDGRYQRGVATGWIAIGDISLGVIVSIGAVAFGGVAVGGLSLGLVSLGGLALGGLALGGAAIGVAALGGAAIAFHAAVGGAAIAQEFAEGGFAVARHANDEVARRYFEGNPIFWVGRFVAEYSRWGLLVLLVPLIYQLIKRRRAEEPRR